MRLVAILIAAFWAAFAPAAALHAQDTGRFVEIGPQAVSWLPDQQLTIWLPPGYDESDRRYPVLYMHDGHNLFDPEKASYGKVWAADKAVLQLVQQGVIEPHIIVGIWAPGHGRYRQYMPYPIAKATSGDLLKSVEDMADRRSLMSRRYLGWLADELKPRIDAEYRTLTGPEHTTIAGSSMGGIMSCWAIAERPDIYGRAACVSSHWPIADPDVADANRAQVLAIWRTYLTMKLGLADGRKVWMDHGTATLDQYYAPYQEAIDESFKDAGWRRDIDFKTSVYQGAEHDEIAWAARLPEILTWLLTEQ